MVGAIIIVVVVAGMVAGIMGLAYAAAGVALAPDNECGAADGTAALDGMDDMDGMDRMDYANENRDEHC